MLQLVLGGSYVNQGVYCVPAVSGDNSPPRPSFEPDMFVVRMLRTAGQCSLRPSMLACLVSLMGGLHAVLLALAERLQSADCVLCSSS